jgi:hypothetical protein
MSPDNVLGLNTALHSLSYSDGTCLDQRPSEVPVMEVSGIMGTEASVEYETC